MDQIPKKKFKAIVTKSQIIASGVKKITFKISEAFFSSPWEYVWIEIPNMRIVDIKGSRRAFSLLNYFSETNEIEIVARISETGYKQNLFALKKGDEVFVHGPFGSAFYLGKSFQPKHIVMVAGGVGIAAFLPILQMIHRENLPITCTLIYLNKNKLATPFLKELSKLGKEAKFLEIIVQYEYFSQQNIESLHLENREDAVWWISGPQLMVDHVYHLLEQSGISKFKMSFENFYPKNALALNIDLVKKQTDETNLFMMAIQNSMNHTIITDTNGVILFANKAAQEITGYSLDEMLGNTPRLWGGMMSRDFYIDFWKKKRSGESFQFEVINRRKNGDTYYTIAHVSPIFDREHQITGYIGTEEDITTLKNAEKQIQVKYDISAELVKAIFSEGTLENILSIIASVFDWDFASVWIPEEKTGSLHAAHIWKKNPGYFLEFEKITKSITFKPGIGLPGRVYKNKKSEWVSNIQEDQTFLRATSAREEGLYAGFAFPIFSGNKVYAVMDFFVEKEKHFSDTFFTNTFDIIGNEIGLYWKHREEEKHIAVNEKRLKYALEGSRDGLWDWKIDTNEVYFSPRLKEMLGIDAADDSFTLQTLHTFIHPRDLALVEDSKKRLIEGKIEYYETKYRIICKDTSQKWILDRGIITERNSSNIAIRAVGTFTDITELKDRENELQKLNDLMIGRELKMIELKEKIKELQSKVYDKL